MSHPIADVLPARARAGAYVVLGLVMLSGAAVHLAFSSNDRSTPGWVTAMSIALTLVAAVVAARAAADGVSDHDYEEQRRLARRDRGDVAEHATVEPKILL